MSKPQFLDRKDGHRIAYHKREGAQPGIVFLGGFRSDMQGSKAMALEKWCKEQRRQFIRFDYFGHGQSSGEFVEGTIGRWAEDAVAVLDELAGPQPQLIVGSSMGGWLMLLLALKRPQKVAGLLGIAAAPDFTELLIWDKLSPEDQTQLRETGKVEMPNCYDDAPYTITMQLIAESANHLLMDGPIAIHCPVRLVHGMQDADVPWETAMALNEKLQSQHVKALLVEDGDHRLSSEKHLKIITKQLVKLEMECRKEAIKEPAFS